MNFDGKLLIMGCGSVSQCTIPLILKHIKLNPKNITVLDFVDNRRFIRPALKKGVKYAQKRITPKNLAKVLGSYVGDGDMILDLAWNIDCLEMLTWCRNNNVRYINTSIEEWDPYKDMDKLTPQRRSLYYRQMLMRKMIKGWGDNNGPTAVLEHGANPGLVSHFTKVGLIDIAKKIIKQKPGDKRVKALKKALADRNFPMLARLEGVKVIHISERDTQITDKPKEVNEFVNTWSIEGFREEGLATAEMGWGTHERKLPKGAYTHKEGPRNQICLARPGIKTWVRSFVPGYEITGMVVRHGEAFSISDSLTVWKNGRAIYRPTVHYAYCPCEAAINSLHELEMRQFELQPRLRIMSDEITKGEDILGVLLMGHDFNSWWVGSLLDIHEARKLVPHQNATTLQVACSAMAAMRWMMKNPREGVQMPDALPHDEILRDAKPYLGPFISKAYDWTPIKYLNNPFRRFDNSITPKEKDTWQFETFLVK